MDVLDINADLGESFGNWTFGDDAALLDVVSSANIACGFHGGDPLTMLDTVALAHERGVAVGSHPGLPDLLGFGRRVLDVSPEDLAAYFVYQVGALRGAAERHGAQMHHVKPHGVLPRMLRDDEALAVAVAEALAAIGVKVVYLPAPVERSAFGRAASAAGIQVVGEIYPDLSYRSDGSLIVQRTKGMTDLTTVEEQVGLFLEEGCVLAEDGSRVPLDARSVCVHSDGPNAVDVAKTVRRVIERSGRTVAVPPDLASGDA